MHENIKVNINCSIKKNPKTNRNIENISWIPCYSCSPISSFPFHIPALWSVVIFHGTCLIHSNYSPQTKPVKKFPSEGFFTEKYRNTEPGRFHRGTLFSTNFHKMPACLVPSQLLGLLQRSLTMQMSSQLGSPGSPDSQSQEPQEPPSLSEVLISDDCFGRGRKGIHSPESWHLRYSLRAFHHPTAHSGGNFTPVQSLQDTLSQRSASYWDCIFLCCLVSFS